MNRDEGFKVPKFSDFAETDHIDDIPGRKTGTNNPYYRLLSEFVSSGKQMVVKSFNSSYEAQLFCTRINAHVRKFSGVKVSKRGEKVYLVRES